MKKNDEHLTAIEMKLAYMEDFVNQIQTRRKMAGHMYICSNVSHTKKIK